MFSFIFLGYFICFSEDYSVKHIEYKCRKLLPGFFIQKSGNYYHEDSNNSPVELRCRDDRAILGIELSFHDGYARVDWECGNIVRM